MDHVSCAVRLLNVMQRPADTSSVNNTENFHDYNLNIDDIETVFV